MRKLTAEDAKEVLGLRASLAEAQKEICRLRECLREAETELDAAGEHFDRSLNLVRGALGTKLLDVPGSFFERAAASIRRLKEKEAAPLTPLTIPIYEVRSLLALVVYDIPVLVKVLNEATTTREFMLILKSVFACAEMSAPDGEVR